MAKCPLCKKEMNYEFRPFCSRACKNTDLNRWLSNHYVLKDELFEKEIIQDFSDEEEVKEN